MTWIKMAGNNKWHALRKENGNGLMTLCGLTALIGTPTSESVVIDDACPDCWKMLSGNGE